MASDDNIPTLAELRRGRAARGVRRATAVTVEAPGLFDVVAEAGLAGQSVASAVAERTVVQRAAAPEATPAGVEARVWSVGALVRQVRSLVERSYGGVSVEGEISNWRPAASGHCYFTLKDDAAQLSIVMFRKQASLLRFKPKDGDAVRLRGQLSVYESRGQMQLVAEAMEPMGLGALLAAVRELKERLRREGLFERKRPLPEFPRCIGIVTSLQGAALRDIVKVCRRRHAAVQLLVYPAAVQGPRCAAEVAAGVRWFSRNPDRAEVVIVARGGGSWEDLHGFDDEAVARAIAACAVPVVVGVGHATDSTIADAAADICAPTPSAAAELVTAAQHRVEERVERLYSRVVRSGQYEILRARQRLSRLSSEMVLRRVRDGLGQRAQLIDELEYRAEAAESRRLRTLSVRLERLQTRLRQQDVERKLVRERSRLEALRVRLDHAGHSFANARTLRVERAESRLEALSPVRVLERGYALVYGADGKLLHSTEDVREGETVVARLAKGRLHAQVLSKANE